MPSTSAWSAWPSSAWRTYREALNKSCRARRCFSGMRCQAPDPRQAWTACLVWQQRRSPGKAPSRRARTKTGPLSTKFLARASSTGCETLAAKSSRFCLERAWQLFTPGGTMVSEDVKEKSKIDAQAAGHEREIEQWAKTLGITPGRLKQAISV